MFLPNASDIRSGMIDVCHLFPLTFPFSLDPELAQLPSLIVTCTENVCARLQLKLKDRGQGDITLLPLRKKNRTRMYCLFHPCPVVDRVYSGCGISTVPSMSHRSVNPMPTMRANHCTLSMRQVATESGHETLPK